MKPLPAFCCLIVYLLIACNNAERPKQSLEEKREELDLGKLDDEHIYSVDEIGWKASLPGDWKIMSKRVNEKLIEIGQDAIEKTYKTQIDVSDMVVLINMQKDKFNSFQAHIQPFDSSFGAYEDQAMQVQNSIGSIYKAQQVKFEQSLGAVRIDGIMFDRIEMKIYSPDSKKIMVEQKMLYALINGYIFCMIVNYNNDEDEKTLTKLVMNSSFSIKE